METETGAAKVLRESFAQIPFLRHPHHRLPDRPADLITLPIQPTPLGALVVTTPDGRWTALTRAFREGEARWCRLCPREECTLLGESCLVVVPGRIPDDQALLFSTVGLPFDRGPD